MVDAHLNEATIEEAHAAYLKRWHLASVQSAWNGRKPSLAQYTKRFGKKYEARQKYLARQSGETTIATIAADQREDVVQAIAERLLAAVGGGSVTEPEDVILGLEDAEDNEPTLLQKLGLVTAPSKTTTKKEPEQKFVKPENFDELPRSGQLYFLLHRAAEAGLSYAIVPLKRGVIAECISQIKDDGRSYQAVASDLVKAR